MIKKNTVVGLGEIGSPILQLISKVVPAIGYDINPKLMNQQKFEKYQDVQTSFLHVCIPFTKNFLANVISLYYKFKPECIVVHSTVSPNTTSTLQSKLNIPVIYSATRGVHKRMLYDLKRYIKFFAVESNAPRANWASSTYSTIMKKCGSNLQCY